MNDNNLNNNIGNNSQDSTYHATSNLNTAIENPQANIGSATRINIQDNINLETNNNNNNINNINNENITYQPNIMNT